jgi:pimeloyl-ACP methyl ester carboxylesterase
VVGLLTDPERLSLAESPSLNPVALMPSAGYLPPFRLHGYSGLIRGLRNGLGMDRPVRVDAVTTLPGYERDLSADVVLFPYDFRLGVRAAGERLAAEIRARLDGLSPRQRIRRVIVVGHSMGGLVARYWAGLPGQAALCRAVVTVGTPHLGAPKAVDWVVNGAALGPGPVRAATRSLLNPVTDVLRGWPAVYDLLPTYHAVLDETGPSTPVPRCVGELAGRADGGFVADPAFAAGVRAAGELHEEISRAWSGQEPQLRPPVVAFLARDHGTPNAVFWRDGRLEVTDEDPPWQPNAGWRGDGTVPAIAAMPAELQGQRELEHPLTERHTPMASAGSVVRSVRALTGDDGPVRGDTLEGARLGLDLDDAGLVGEPVPVRVRLVRRPDGSAAAGSAAADPEARDVEVSLLVEPADGSRAPVRVSMGPDGDGWAAGFVPPSAGAWRVTAEATGVPGQVAPRVEDVVGVLDPDASHASRSGDDGGGR